MFFVICRGFSVGVCCSAAVNCVRELERTEDYAGSMLTSQ
jgi:hypothetical protein